MSAPLNLYERIYRTVRPLFGRGRMARFAATVRPAPHERLLDVGGSAAMWERVTFPLAAVHVLNPDPDWLRREGDAALRILPLIGDALNLPAADGGYDILFSNSVIEHVGTWDNQVRFADEARRAGKRLWIQTPAREFFFEPHYLTPFIHYAPRTIQRRLVRHFTVRGWLLRPSPAEIDAFLDEIRLLTYAEMRLLFPDCIILRETVLGMTKSYIAFRA